MLPRDRVLSAIEHREPDRVPFDLGGTFVTGIHHIAYDRLVQSLEIDSIPTGEVRDIITQQAQIDRQVLERLEVDCRMIDIRVEGDSNSVRQEGQYQCFRDGFGIQWAKPNKSGLYFDMQEHPFSGTVSLRDVENIKLPDLPSRESIQRVRAAIEQSGDDARYAFTLVPPGGGGIFELASWIRGFKDFYIDLIRHPSFVEALLDKLVEFKMRGWERLLEGIGDIGVVALEADDLATQERPLVSPTMYRRLVKPRHKRLFASIKECSPAPIYIFLHSCGAVRDLIPDLIDVGVDILNPVQVNAASMDTRKLKRDFGNQLTFWGGGVDTQRVLPYGSPDEVRDEVKRRIDDLAPGGGFVFSTVHNIQADVPPENVLAMWEAMREYGVY